jgi:hypothetical protein
MSSLESQENKQLLWGILAEEGIFDTVPESVSTEEVKHIFERIIRNLSASIPTLLATRLKELYIAKERAIAEEDYDAAKTIRASIEQIEAPSARILKNSAASSRRPASRRTERRVFFVRRSPRFCRRFLQVKAACG